ncbi:type II secretion system GspH family protein [Halorhodospira halochloris]|uniref:type II secretion system protein n=1 Tax=Halorhodospira halochloris TaxID=1052 RepID=UPI001EE8CC2F|nr:type II secretion system protein [Halorhodospira halochloris]MCG5531105.1 type II secretion system GspH family protein [Halorhodospira halochloris]MCG5549297.1 type II secretion system GspH family protein [Halorhodospira halochloris]
MARLHIVGAQGADGFTLVEVVLIVIILAILASIAVPNFGGAQEQLELDKVESQLVSDLRVLRQDAMGCGGSDLPYIDFQEDGQGWTVCGCGGSPCRDRGPYSGLDIDEAPENQIEFQYPDGSHNEEAPQHIKLSAEDGDAVVDLCVYPNSGSVNRNDDCQ